MPSYLRSYRPNNDNFQVLFETARKIKKYQNRPNKKQKLNAEMILHNQATHTILSKLLNGLRAGENSRRLLMNANAVLSRYVLNNPNIRRLQKNFNTYR